MRLIHDVTTDPDDPPQFTLLADLRKRANGAAYSGLTAEQHRRRYPDLTPALFDEPPLKVFMAAYEITRARKWYLYNARKWRMDDGKELEGRIEATASTRILRFKDDVVIRVRASGNAAGGTRLDMRSASRIGKSDFGANARRIRSFLDELKYCLKSNT